MSRFLVALRARLCGGWLSKGPTLTAALVIDDKIVSLILLCIMSMALKSLRLSLCTGTFN